MALDSNVRISSFVIPIDFVFKIVIFYFAGAVLWVIASKDNA